MRIFVYNWWTFCLCLVRLSDFLFTLGVCFVYVWGGFVYAWGMFLFTLGVCYVYVWRGDAMWHRGERPNSTRGISNLTMIMGRSTVILDDLDEYALCVCTGGVSIA